MDKGKLLKNLSIHSVRGPPPVRNRRRPAWEFSILDHGERTLAVFVGVALRLEVRREDIFSIKLIRRHGRAPRQTKNIVSIGFGFAAYLRRIHCKHGGAHDGIYTDPRSPCAWERSRRRPAKARRLQTGRRQRLVSGDSSL
jgi:hypothetical protein